MDDGTLLRSLLHLRLWCAGRWIGVQPLMLPPGDGIGLWAGRRGEEQHRLIRAIAGALAAGQQIVLSDTAESMQACSQQVAWRGSVSTLDDMAKNVPVESSLKRSARPLIVLTSGTEGTPKAVEVPWRRITSSSPQQTTGDERWLLLYSLTRFAGLAVLGHCVVHGQSLVIPADPGDPEQAISDAIAADANCVSATPSWMRRLLMTVPTAVLGQWKPRQITLGGEAASQSILDRITHHWPEARLTHIYAATEVGTCFSVSDRREGIPVAKLERGRSGVVGRLEGEELVIRVHGVDIRTGDLFEKVGERIVFRGRKSEIINVGGNKVSPHRVEAVLSSHSDVRDLRVYGRRNALTGEGVAVEVVSDSAGIADELMRLAQQKLAKHEWPMIIRRVKRIETSPADKTLRRKA
jgi:acyl-CoA synthetase (AMP-forming)/AMP-acid ligase II